jgi:XTP/dITP diphosphohydrolase/ATP diphosphatase
VLRNWEQIKGEEKKQKGEPRASLLDDVPRSMPAVLEAAKLGSKAAKVGFDWPDPDGRATGLFEKLQEEIAELQAEIVELQAVEIAPESRNGDAPSRAAIEAELGDVLFTAVNLARHLKIDPESALRATNAKFRRRFGAMEKAAGDADTLEQRTPTELEALWSRAKLEEVP